MLRWILCAAGLLPCACTSDPAAPPERPHHPEHPDAGTGGCAPGESAKDDGCVPAGIPASACGQGFEPDDASGCRAVLPAGTCADGLMAVPGETTCREVAPCDAGTWGTIPVGPDTQYVDAAYVGAPSDGTAAHPWTTIQPAVDAATPGAVVAIAEGAYLEDVVVQKPVRIWGRCPALVEITGVSAESALFVGKGADGTEIHTVAVTGPGEGIGVPGAKDVVIDRVWVHDTGFFGIDLVSAYGKTAASVSGVLVERAMGGALLVEGASAKVAGVVLRGTQPRDDAASGVYAINRGATRSTLVLEGSVVEQGVGHGAFIEGSDATFETTVVRDTKGEANSTNLAGRGVAVQTDAQSGERGNLKVHASVIERNRDTGLYCSACDLDMEATVVRDTEPRASDMMFGHGINVQPHNDGARSNASIRASVIANNRESALRVSASDAKIEGVVVRGTTANAAPDGAARGIDVVHNTNGARSVVEISGSLVEFNHGHGLLLQASDVTVTATAVRDTLAADSGILGRGIEINDGAIAPMRANVTISGTAVERCLEMGIVVFGSDATLSGSSIVDVVPRTNGQRFGRGIAAEPSSATGEGATLSLTNTRVERCRQVGVSVLNSVATLEGVFIKDVGADAEGFFGDGVSVTGPSTAAIAASRVEGSARAGVANFGASVSLASTELECNPVPLDGEPWSGASPAFEDLGGNTCGCKAEVQACKVVSAALEPPKPIDDPTP